MFPPMSDAVDRLNAVLSPRYRLERKLGEGGMATVFLAEDLRHKRQVAIKVLTPAVAAALGAGRFLAEIETTAGLHHPHILPLFDSGEADGFLYYVMPHVKGETLRDRLEREGQLPVDEAVTLAEKVAGAPQAAHDAGIVHRDVKPSNILISKGEPLVADFGIALAVQAGGAQRLTETGLRVGTTHYMSPEQAAGDETVGPRTDVFALGCVVFEMLVGHPPFQASTPHAVLAKILTGGAPRTSAERASVPPHVEAAIAKALETVPSDRFRSAGAFAAALRNPAFRHPAPDHGGREGPGRAPAWKVLSEVLAVAVIAAGWMAFRSTSAARDAPLPSFRIPMRFPQEQALAGTGHFDLSSDGSVLVYQGVGEEGRTRLWVRRGDAEEASPIQGAAGLSASIVPDIALSPSGERVGFWKGRDYQVVSTAGGVPRVVADSLWGVARWSKDGEWLYLRRFGHPGISRVPARGGEPEVVTRPNTAAGISGHVWPDPLEGGEGLVLEGRGEEGSRILVVNLETGETRDLGPGRYPRYADGWLLYGTEDRNRLLAAPFDPGSLELTGSPRTLLDDIAAWGPSLA
ncbi:MAG: serine/threonine-protein kinase, partial [Gemmatimonadota bacterium]